MALKEVRVGTTGPATYECRATFITSLTINYNDTVNLKLLKNLQEIIIMVALFHSLIFLRYD